MPAHARQADPLPATPSPSPSLFYAAAFIAALSAVAYELLLASYATFLLGATIFQYSLVMSLMMASMGLGSLLTSYLRKRYSAEAAFLGVELSLACLASVALPVLYTVYAYQLPARFFIGLFVVAIGALIGMEIPLVAEAAGSPRRLPRILFYDYLGGFLGGLLFPLLLVPALGLFRVAALLGVMNAGVALRLLAPFRHRLGAHPERWIAAAVLVALVAVAAFATAEPLRRWLEARYFGIGVS